VVPSKARGLFFVATNPINCRHNTSYVIKNLLIFVNQTFVMEKIEFKATINAPAEKVWKILWDDASYRKWTSVFAEGSKAESDWQEGSKILFLDGKGQGMVSIIESKRDNEFMSFKHVGIISEGVEDTTSEKVKAWAGAHENYTLRQTNGKTELIVDMDLSDEWKEYFNKTWPLAMNKIKELAEQ
jgi:ribosome-associated toxin RatA of RatAB toxin-antitoxin module